MKSDYFNPDKSIDIRYGNLPHWRQDDSLYFVTFRLADSLPQSKLRRWRAERERWFREHPEPYDDATSLDYFVRFSSRMHYWLDQGYGECLLARREVRQIVIDAFSHFDAIRYLLDVWAVVPNHVHLIVAPARGYDLSNILHSWKSYTAKRINRMFGRSGAFWQSESYDHIIRHAEAHERICGK